MKFNEVMKNEQKWSDAPSDVVEDCKVKTEKKVLPEKNKYDLVWWRVYIQLLPGLSFNWRKKNSKTPLQINKSNKKETIFRRYLLFEILPGIFFELVQLKYTHDIT